MVFLTVVSVDYNGGLIAAQLYFTIHISVFYFMNATGLFWTTWGLLFCFESLAQSVMALKRQAKWRK